VRIWRVEPGEEGDPWRAEVVADFGKGARIGMVDVSGLTVSIVVSIGSLFVPPLSV
jgi:hypothetical protein